jgi:hypothetical protein
MVLRDAALYAVVDGSHGGHIRPGPVSGSHAVPTILQLPSGLRQVPGE